MKKKVYWSFPGCPFFFSFQKTGKYLKSNLVLVDITVYESEGFFYFTLWVDLVRKDRPKTQKLVRSLDLLKSSIEWVVFSVICYWKSFHSLWLVPLFLRIFSLLFIQLKTRCLNYYDNCFFYEYSIVKFLGAEERRREAYSVIRRFLRVFTLFRIRAGCFTY